MQDRIEKATIFVNLMSKHGGKLFRKEDKICISKSFYYSKKFVTFLEEVTSMNLKINRAVGKDWIDGDLIESFLPLEVREQFIPITLI